jgi:predicted PurR-regulated permease PerM
VSERRIWRGSEMPLIVLAVLALVATAKFTDVFLIPVVAGIVGSYALKPVVTAMAKAHIPRPLGASIVLVVLSAIIVGGGYWLRDDAAALLADLPDAVRKVRTAAQQSAQQPKGAIERMRAAAVELDRAAAAATGTAPPSPAQAEVLAVSSRVREWLAMQSAKVFGVITELGLAAALAWLLLASGDTFRRKLVQLVGPTLQRRRVTVEILDEIDSQVQRYMLVTLVTNVTVGFATWAILAALGIERAALLGVVAALLHIVPYLGTAMTAGIVGVTTLMQMGSPGTAAFATLAVFVVDSAIGIGLSTWLQGRASRMNPVALFVAILFFAWLWGGWGLLLGAPLVAILKTVCERVEALNPVGAFLEADGTRPASRTLPQASASEPT